MKYYKEISLKNGKSCVLRSCTRADAQAVLAIFNLTHEQTDFLLTYSDETSFTLEEEADFLERLDKSEGGIEMVAELDGKIVGSAGFDAVGSKKKIKHRAEFGISVDKAYWGLGIGRALTKACIDCAKEAGYLQLELDVIAENKKAIALYESEGFVEFGRNPRGFRTREGSWQEVILMRREM